MATWSPLRLRGCEVLAPPKVYFKPTRNDRMATGYPPSRPQGKQAPLLGAFVCEPGTGFSKAWPPPRQRVLPRGQVCREQAGEGPRRVSLQRRIVRPMRVGMLYHVPLITGENNAFYNMAKIPVFAKGCYRNTPSVESKIECLDELLLSDLLCIS